MRALLLRGGLNVTPAVRSSHDYMWDVCAG